MAHKHSVYDTDSHFKINKVTHAIQNDSGKIVLIQYDHNSERFTFEIPRLVDGHDMSLCNEVQVHYINIDSADKTKISKDAHDLTDLQISPDDNDVVICSWLIDGNATKYAGSLNFLVKFKCVTDGVTEYVWNTAIHTGVSVSSGMDNGEAIVEDYSDILEQWRQELVEAGGGSVSDEQIAQAVEDYMADHPISGGNTNQGAENANLPMIVGEDGNVAPSKLKPIGIVGATQDSSINEDITVSWEDGRYVTNPSNGSIGTLARLSIGTTSEVVPGVEYEFTPYLNPTLEACNTICFYDSSNKAINALGSKPYYTFTFFDDVNNVYRVIAPPKAAYARYNVFITDKDTSYFRKASETYSFDWLAVSANNITPHAKEEIAEHTKGYLNADCLKYGHSLKKPFNFNGKSLIAFGDSITAGISSPGLVSVDSYSKRFADMNNMSYSSNAVSGSHITDEEDAEYSIYKRISGWTGTADFAIIAGGINDYSNGKTLGTYEDTADTLSFYGSLRKICENLSENHPDTTVIFITPINCTRNPENATNPLNDYRNAIFEIATTYGFNVVDGSQLGFPSETGSFQVCMLEDGLHPTDTGHSFYAKNLCGVLL